MNSYDCVIVGAGIGGLYISRKLEEKGHSCLILESQDRIGGRIDTKFKDERSFEFGAARILESQIRVMKLVKKLNLDLEKQILDDAAVYLNGKWHPSLNSVLKNMNYPDPFDLFEELLEEFAICDLESFETKAPVSWDGILTRDWLESKGIPLEYAKLFFLGDIDTELENITLYESMFFYAFNLSKTDSTIYRLSGGMNALIEKLAWNNTNIQLNHHVLSVEKKSEEFTINTNYGQISAKQLIFTCSLNALSNINLPEEADQKIKYWLTIGHYGKSVKGYFRLASNPFPDDTYLMSDVPLRMLRRGDHLWEFYLPSLFTSWDEEKIRILLNTYFGEGKLIELHLKKYTDEPYFGCYWNYFSGKFHHIFEASRESVLEKGIFSAGEHFSLNPNWIEGTLESADNFLNLLYEK